jgi:DNA-binding PadR family transcriptional regulator
VNLTPTSYIVLGLIRYAGSATPYDLKVAIPPTVGNFWTIPHSQLYAEPDRLTEAGYLKREQESGGRRRKSYRVTPAGVKALDAWLGAGAAGGVPELRDPALLKLFFGSDPAQLAAEQLELYESKLAEWEEMRASDTGEGPRGPWLALDAGMGHARESIRFWRELAKGR